MSIEVYLMTYDGRQYEVPKMLSYSFSRGAGTPCDSFDVEFAFQENMTGILPRVIRLFAVKDGVRFFSGVLDEYEISLTERGQTVTLSGRGYAAELLDNQVRSAQFSTATLEDILTQYVYPTGIVCGETQSIEPVSEYIVPFGSSRWQALYGFTYYSAKITPRFDGSGRLILKKKCSGQHRLVDDDTPVERLNWKEKRYGVISRVFVINKGTLDEEIVENADFESRGGVAHRVIAVPKKTLCKAMRYSGQYQIERSAEREKVVTLDLPGFFEAEPEDVVTLDLKKYNIYGSLRLGEVTHSLDSYGETTRLELLKAEG